MSAPSPIRLPSRTGFCWLATVALGWSLIAFALFRTMSAGHVSMVAPLVTASVMVLVLEMLPVQVKLRHYNGAIVVSSPFVFAVMFVWGPWVAIVVRVVGSVCTDTRARRQWYKIVFNPALYALTAFSGWAVLAVGGSTGSLAAPTPVLAAGDLPMIAVSWVGWFVVNELLVAGVVPGRIRSLTAAPAEFARDSLLNLGVLAMSVLVVAITISYWFLTPMLFVPLLLLRWTGQVARDREHDAAHDTLTGLPNRLAFRVRLDQAVTGALRGSAPFALMLIDLNDFKKVNDTLGHQAGDDLLAGVGQRLLSGVRPTDVVARLGGDEFAIIAMDVDAVGAATVAANIRRAFEQPVLVGATPVVVHFALGIALHPPQGADATTLLRNADVAMYRAKNLGTGIETYRSDRDEPPYRRPVPRADTPLPAAS